MSPDEIIIAAGVLLSKPQHFAQGAIALSRKGEPCLPHIKRAVRWDAIGALYKGHSKPILIDDKGGSPSWERDLFAAIVECQLAANRLYKASLEVVNDTRGREDVLACYRAAIKSCRVRSVR